MRLQSAYILLSLDKHYNLVCFLYKRPVSNNPVKLLYKLFMLELISKKNYLSKRNHLVVQLIPVSRFYSEVAGV